MQRAVKSRLTSFVALLALIVAAAPAGAADDTKAREGAAQVESGAKQVGRGVEDTAKGIGKTVVGGARRRRASQGGGRAGARGQVGLSRTREGAVSFGTA